MSNILNKKQKNYRNIFIVDSLTLWNQMDMPYDINKDLVLTYDFELKHYISKNNGSVMFLDHLVSVSEMQKNNFLIYEFFRDWHYDKNANDIFTYKNIPFGFSFRLEFWNDFVYYSRLYACLKTMKIINYDTLYVNSNDDTIISVLEDIDVDFVNIDVKSINETAFYFPIAKWLNEQIRPKGIRVVLYRTRELVTFIFGYLKIFINKFFNSKHNKTIFIQEYHPTKNIIRQLRADNDTDVLLINFSRNSKIYDNLKENLLPIGGSLSNYEKVSIDLMAEFDKEKVVKLILSDGSDITDSIYKIIEKRISSRLVNILRTLDGCIKYLDNNKVDLEILIANIGHTVTLFDMVCKYKKIPSYMIINGLLGPAYYDEAKYATVINAYSKSIKENYFKGMNNIVTLGDPRMDMYSISDVKTIDRHNPTITIGASGFNSADLNSYVAVEFDFMYDVLSSFQRIIKKGNTINIIIKVRGNGYREQYEDFIEKFFSTLSIQIIDITPMKEVLLKTDFYISIYSQTLFEASCLGIPVVYYKKDTEIMDPPFDNNSELVTITNIDDLVQAFYDFQNKNTRYNAFLDRKIMEKYIGPLDGRNLQRNIDFIYKLLDKESKND